MKRYKLLLLSCLLAFVHPLAFSQELSMSDIKDNLNILFSNLDKTKIPTGFLWDIAVNLVERDDYNGTAITDSNYVTLSLMGDMLYSINSASVGADTIGVQAAITRLQRNSSSTSQKVGILFQPYNYIVFKDGEYQLCISRARAMSLGVDSQTYDDYVSYVAKKNERQ